MAGGTLRSVFSSRTSWGSGVPARLFKRFLPLFSLFWPGPPGLEAASAFPNPKPAAPTPFLEAGMRSARNVLVVRLVKRYPRDERLSYRGRKGSYATAGLEVEVKAVLIGAAMTGDRFQVVYLKAVESKDHGFRPGRDYLLVLKENTPDFLDVTPWEQVDGAYAIQGGYLPKAPLLDLVSAFWVGPMGGKAGRSDLNRSVQNRLEAIRLEIRNNPAVEAPK